MPNPGCSSDELQVLEDEMAVLITAADHVDRVRAFGTVLRQRGMITDPTYRDLRDSLDYIAHGIHIGRRNTARLRRRD